MVFDQCHILIHVCRDRAVSQQSNPMVQEVISGGQEWSRRSEKKEKWKKDGGRPMRNLGKSEAEEADGSPQLLFPP